MHIDGKDYRAKDVLDILIERDGLHCYIPECKNPDYFPHYDPPNIDHTVPLSRSGTNTWDNMRPAHVSCNSRKADRLILPDGTLEPTGKMPKPAKVPHRDPTDCCYEGRLLLEGEVCFDCGSEPQPKKYPRWAQKSSKECTHSRMDHCWLCVLGFVERVPASSDVFGLNPEGIKEKEHATSN